MAYATLAELKQWLNIQDSSKDMQLQTLLDGASAYIDKFCRRSFLPSPLESRTYVLSLDGDVVYTHDIVTLENVSVDGELATATLVGAGPYIGVRLDNRVRSGTKVVVTASFGYGTTVPAEIKLATLRIAGAMFRQAEAGFSEAIATGELGTINVTRSMDSFSRQLISQYRRLRFT